MQVIWQANLGDFLLVTVFLGGAAAFLVGRAMALTWRPLPTLAFYVVLLNCAVRFIHYALFGGILLSPQLYLVDLVVLLIIAWLGYRITRVSQMVGQYSWLYRRTSRLTWRARTEEAAGRPDQVASKIAAR